jgi:hypothetical protein
MSMGWGCCCDQSWAPFPLICPWLPSYPTVLLKKLDMMSEHSPEVYRLIPCNAGNPVIRSAAALNEIPFLCFYRVLLLLLF